MKSVFLTFLFVIIGLLYCFSQFHPAAGISGTNAIYKDSSIIKTWATSCSISRGYIKISDTSVYFSQNGINSNKAFFGDEQSIIGYPSDINHSISLGDGGSAVLSFDKIIFDGDGYDFAVFENGLKSNFSPFQYFLELAFVEVSSNGVDFVRFPSVSYTQTETQISTYGQLYPEKINNLAGKFIVDYGTPFDLSELKDSLRVNINKITHIRIVDVIGSVDDNYCSFDIYGNKINDPYPTPFWTSGFDLSGIGVINCKSEFTETELAQIYPNPFTGLLKIYSNAATEIRIYDINGKLTLKQSFDEGYNDFDFSFLKDGIYFIKLISDLKTETYKIIKI